MSEVCKKMYPHEDTEELIKFFGDPRGRNGNYSTAWYKENMVKWVPPYQIYYSDGKKTPFKALWLHKKVYDTFDGAYKEVLNVFGIEKIKELRLDISGGLYNYRLIRGGNRLSVHSWGIAIDMDPAGNPFPKKWKKGMIDLQFCDIMEKHGFWWRGRNGDNDCMHFSAATADLH